MEHDGEYFAHIVHTSTKRKDHILLMDYWCHQKVKKTLPTFKQKKFGLNQEKLNFMSTPNPWKCYWEGSSYSWKKRNNNNNKKSSGIYLFFVSETYSFEYMRTIECFPNHIRTIIK